MADNDMSIVIEGKRYLVDEFELGELEWLEEHIGSTLDDPKAMASMKAAVGFVYLIKHREDDTFTLDDARKIKLAVFDEPQNGNGKPAKRRPTKARGTA